MSYIEVNHITKSFKVAKKKSGLKEAFKSDCEWLKSVLGEPTKTGSNGIVYFYDTVNVGATLQECDGLIGPDEHIKLNYQRGN